MATLQGRTEILTQFSPQDMEDYQNVKSLVNTTMMWHVNSNKPAIDYLLNYYKGIQPILGKTKEVREEINNIMVVNHAQRITRTIVGYFLGNPIQYIQSGTSSLEEVDELNRILSYEDKSTVDKEIAEYQSICGTGFRIIYADSNDDVPFEDRSLNPSTTYVAYENSIGGNPVAGVTFLALMDAKGNLDGYVYYVYTEGGVYTIRTNGLMEIRNDDEYMFTPYRVGGIPLIEYPNNAWRLGDWELMTYITDSINKLQSGRLDDIEQIIQSLLVFTNAEIDANMYTEMRESGIVMLKNTTNNQTSVDVIKNALDQVGMNTYSKELENLLDTLVGIPSRGNASASTGGDTGTAVELRDGWADLEIVARNKELVFKRSEKKALKIILTILSNVSGFKLSVKDIDIKFTRNKNHNLLVKSQSYMNLLGTQTLAPADCLTIVDLVSDVNEYVARGDAYWESHPDKVVKTSTQDPNAVN